MKPEYELSTKQPDGKYTTIVVNSQWLTDPDGYIILVDDET